MEWYLKVLRQYADFKGRARRKEFWMFYLFNLLVIISMMLLSVLVSATIGVDLLHTIILVLLGLYYLAILVPTLAVTVRRLHDINNSGWMYFVSFIPIIGGIWLLILLCKEGTNGYNDYGDDPKKDININN